MTEFEAKEIIRNDPKGNIAQRMEALAIAEKVLGENYTIEQLWQWAEGKTMNHDYAHCIDFKDDCPKECFRAQLVRDLERNFPYMEVSWMNFKDTHECELKKVKNN